MLALCVNWNKTHSDGRSIEFDENEIISNKNNFMEIYNSLGNSEAEERIKSFIEEKFDLPVVDVFSTILYKNHPNPFNPVTKIKFEIAEEANMELNIYNIKGQLVKSFKKENLIQGEHFIIWRGKDLKDESVSSGMYFYSLIQNGRTVDTKKMLLLK